MNEQQRKTIDELRDAGYCVVVWTPDELKTVSNEWLEERVTAFGNDEIELAND